MIFLQGEKKSMSIDQFFTRKFSEIDQNFYMIYFEDVKSEFQVGSSLFPYEVFQNQDQNSLNVVKISLSD